jgi:hypothetical protein
MEIFVPPALTTGTSLDAFFGAGASAAATAMGAVEGAGTTIAGAGAATGASTTAGGATGSAAGAAGSTAAGTSGAAGAAGAAGTWANAIEVPASNAAKDKLANFLFMRFSSKKKAYVCCCTDAINRCPYNNKHTPLCVRNHIRELLHTNIGKKREFARVNVIFLSFCLIFFGLEGVGSLDCHLNVIFM